MLYVDAVGSTEAEAVTIALRLLRLNREEAVIRNVTETENGVSVRVEATRSRGDETLGILKTLLEGMHIKADLFYIESLDKITINVKGPNLGLVIGRNGSTLDALETLVNAMHNNDSSIYKPVVINPGGYRESRRQALKSLVKRAVELAKNGEKVSLPAMCQRDRKYVHQIIKDFPGFRSRSFGDGIDRRVYIFKSGDTLAEQENDRENFIDVGSEEQFFVPPVEPPPEQSLGL